MWIIQPEVHYCTVWQVSHFQQGKSKCKVGTTTGSNLLTACAVPTKNRRQDMVYIRQKEAFCYMQSSFGDQKEKQCQITLEIGNTELCNGNLQDALEMKIRSPLRHPNIDVGKVQTNQHISCIGYLRMYLLHRFSPILSITLSYKRAFNSR